MRKQISRKRRRAAAFSLFFPLALLLLGFSADAGAAIYEVGVYDYFFEPFELSLQTGDTVEWTAYGFGHTVVSDTGLFDSSLFWSGGSIPALRSFKFTFHEAGRYPYYSLDYGGPEGAGMSATITVTGSTTNQIPLAPANVFPAADATNQPIRAELRAGTFQDGDPGDVHATSQWVVRRADDSQIVYDSGEVIDDGLLFNSKTNRFLPDGLLDYGTLYRWQVRYKDSYGAWSPYSAATFFSTLRPAVRIRRQSSGTVLTWPTNANAFSLEYATNVSAPSWLPASPAPQIVNGQNTVSNGAADGARLYRLRKP